MLRGLDLRDIIETRTKPKPAYSAVGASEGAVMQVVRLSARSKVTGTP